MLHLAVLQDVVELVKDIVLELVIALARLDVKVERQALLVLLLTALL